MKFRCDMSDDGRKCYVHVILEDGTFEVKEELTGTETVEKVEFECLEMGMDFDDVQKAGRYVQYALTCSRSIRAMRAAYNMLRRKDS